MVVDGQQKVAKKHKRCTITIDIVSYALYVSVNDVICVFAVHFRSSHILKFVNWHNI